MDYCADDILLNGYERMCLAISSLPTLEEKDIPLDESCPICLNSFKSIHEGETQSDGTLVGLLVHPIELRGVTKLEGCGHVFCRVDLIEWIRGRHGTCPACRHQFANIRPLTESDYESSDGEYVPGEDDEEEDDGFLDTDDFDGDDFEFDVDEMDLDQSEELEVYLDVHVETDGDVEFDVNVEGDNDVTPEIVWEGGDEDDGMENWGLSDGDGSESLSEGDLFVSGEEELGDAYDAGVYEASDYHSADEGSIADDPK